MGDKTGIQWSDATWNPTTGCDRVSPGCDNCYAMTMAKRLKGMGSAKYQRDGEPATSGPGFGLTVHADALDQPQRWTKPRRIFVNSMSDLFHDDVPDEFIARVWQVMATTPRHTYQILTKRHARMRAWVSRCAVSPGGWITHDGTDPAGACDGSGIIVGYPQPAYERDYTGPRGGKPRHKPQPVAFGWPLPNVWLGVSAEDQKWADIRLPALEKTVAAVRFVSAEPLIGPIRLSEKHGRPDWLIIGGESGPGARRMDYAWAQDLVWQCRSLGITPFVKQFGSALGEEWGCADSHGADWDAWPDSVKVREFPAPAAEVAR